MIAYRAWKVKQLSDGLYLQGSYGKVWPTSRIKASVCPAPNNHAGIYAYTTFEQLRQNIIPFVFVLGVVDLGGTVIHHSDGVLRGHYAAIRGLLVFSDDIVYGLHKTYDVPVASLPSLVSSLLATANQGLCVPLADDMYAVVGDPPPPPLSPPQPLDLNMSGWSTQQTVAYAQQFRQRYDYLRAYQGVRRLALNKLIAAHVAEFDALLRDFGKDPRGRYRSASQLRNVHQREYSQYCDELRHLLPGGSQ